MGHVYVTGVVTSQRSLDRPKVRFMVDTGAHLCALPKKIADALGVVVLGTDRVRLANGDRVDLERTEIHLELEGKQGTVACWIVPNGEPLLGVVALEQFLLTVDPVQKKLVPVEGFLGSVGAAPRGPLVPPGTLVITVTMRGVKTQEEGQVMADAIGAAAQRAAGTRPLIVTFDFGLPEPQSG